MPWRYDLFVTPVAGSWRVSVLDDVATVPECVCDLADHGAALQFARGLAEEMASLGDEVTLRRGDSHTREQTGNVASDQSANWRIDCRSGVEPADS